MGSIVCRKEFDRFYSLQTEINGSHQYDCRWLVLLPTLFKSLLQQLPTLR
jgi:hypothetical protein